MGEVRRWLHATVTVDYPDSTELADDAATVVSELVSNALEAGAHAVVVTASSHRSTVTVTVADDAPGIPRQQPISPDRPSGRGLLIVAALGSGWGVQHTPRGKNVWADLAVSPGVHLGFACHRPIGA